MRPEPPVTPQRLAECAAREGRLAEAAAHYLVAAGQTRSPIWKARWRLEAGALATRAVEAWNARCPIGTQVRYWPWTRDAESQVSTTRSAATLLAAGQAVVFVEGHAGAVALSHVEALP